MAARSVTILRLLIAFEAIALISGLIVDIATENMLSAPLRAAKQAEEESLSLAHLGFGLSILVLSLVAWVGLWRLWRPARALYVALTVLSVIGTALAGPYISTGISEVFAFLGAATEGAILALLYVSDLAPRFSRT